jgi:hypothetical protein
LSWNHTLFIIIDGASSKDAPYFYEAKYEAKFVVEVLYEEKEGGGGSA